MAILNSIFNSVAFAQAASQSSSPVAVLGLNAKLFLAQLINFAIVLFILWKWVFTPVAKKLQERTDRIEKSMNDADRIAKEKKEFEQWRQAELSKARKEASEIVDKSQTEALKVKDELLKQAKEDQQKIVDQSRKQIEQEKQQALQSAKADLADIVTDATEKILRKKLDLKTDQQLVKESLADIK
jgi:F-type H+-transporting ATPase subunit b